MHITEKNIIDQMLRDAPYQPGNVVTFKPGVSSMNGPVILTSKIQRLAFRQNVIIYYIDNNPYMSYSILHKLDVIPRRTLKDI